MAKIPIDISGEQLINKLRKFGYEITRRKGSHVRLTSNLKGKEHHITIPDHRHLKIGTLNNILSDVSDYLEMEKDILIKELFE